MLLTRQPCVDEDAPRRESYDRDPMTHAHIDVEGFRRKLLVLRDGLLQVEQSGREAAQPVELDQSRVGRVSRMDALQAQAMSIETKRRRALQGQRIDAALQRIDNGSFGICLQCGEDINPKRLEFDPSTPVCIECARQGDK